VSVYELQVLDGIARVGALGYDSLDETFSFRYDDTWRTAASTYAISPHVPKSLDSPSSSTVRRFLENLLPEGKALDVVASNHRLSKSNLYGLIRALGGETTGALSFKAKHEPVDEPTKIRRHVPHAELKRRLEQRAELPFAVWDGRIRLSIAGHQDKLAVYMEGDQIFLVEGALASTHLLKPETADARLPMLVANEHFSMCLAARMGIAVAPVSILRVPDPILVVERFDRRRGDLGVQKLHVIDGCQALNLPASYKYERNFGGGRDVRDIRDGVSFERLFSIAEHTLQKAVTRRDLLRWALFQFLIGNADAHGKNVSFFCTPDGLALAPFYDMVSVAQYPDLDPEMAMGYGDEFLPDAVRPYDWARFAESTGTARSLLVREMRRMAKLAPVAATGQAAEPTYTPDERKFLQGIVDFVVKQAGILSNQSAPTLTVVLD